MVKGGHGKTNHLIGGAFAHTAYAPQSRLVQINPLCNTG